jgi:ribonuclease Z
MCCGYWWRSANDVILFDHGFGAHHRLLEFGIHALQVSHIFYAPPGYGDGAPTA